jgi:hypothetical protein
MTNRKGLSKEQVIKIIRSEKVKNILDNEDIEFDGLVIKINNMNLYSII